LCVCACFVCQCMCVLSYDVVLPLLGQT
jgi:hypothetical protein